MPDLTWPSLLAHWTSLARSALALPKDAEGDRWRAAVPSVIALQATAMALRQTDRLDDAQRAVAHDLSSVQIAEHAGVLNGLWRGEPLHAELAALIADAREALRLSRGAGVEWAVTAEEFACEHPAELVGALIAEGFAGDLYVPTPGVSLFKGCPAAFARGPQGGAPGRAVVRAVGAFLGPGCAAGDAPEFRQAYRQFDFARGGPVRDLVVPFDSALPAGQPLLVRAIARGEPVPVTLPPPRGFEVSRLPVVIGEAHQGSGEPS